MCAQTNSIAPKFGDRLREERKRLALNQEQFAQAAGIQRLAQSQYEAESREPRISYLAAIGAAGVDLYYLMFGKRVDGSALTPEQQNDIERRAFDLIEEYVRTQCKGRMSSDGRLVLFRIIRAQLTRFVIQGSSVDLNVSDLLANGSSAHG